MKTLLSIVAFLFVANLCSAQHYVTQTEMDQLAALVQEFDVSYEKLINQKDTDATKQVKKSIYTLSSKMNYYADRISASTSINEIENMGDKSKLLLQHEQKKYRLIQVDYSQKQADQISQYAHNMMNVKDDLKAQGYEINLGNSADVELVNDFHKNLKAFHDMQSSKFTKSYKATR